VRSGSPGSIIPAVENRGQNGLKTAQLQQAMSGDYLGGRAARRFAGTPFGSSSRASGCRLPQTTPREGENGTTLEMSRDQQALDLTPKTEMAYRRYPRPPLASATLRLRGGRVLATKSFPRPNVIS
jgi:hypothetical protein